jgi:hypothetical protein
MTCSYQLFTDLFHYLFVDKKAAARAHSKNLSSYCGRYSTTYLCLVSCLLILSLFVCKYQVSCLEFLVTWATWQQK